MLLVDLLELNDLKEEEILKVKANNNLDIAIYERALNDTNKMIALQPPSFWEELKEYKRMLAGNKALFCLLYAVNLIY